MIKMAALVVTNSVSHSSVLLNPSETLMITPPAPDGVLLFVICQMIFSKAAGSLKGTMVMGDLCNSIVYAFEYYRPLLTVLFCFHYRLFPGMGR